MPKGKARRREVGGDKRKSGSGCSATLYERTWRSWMVMIIANRWAPSGGRGLDDWVANSHSLEPFSRKIPRAPPSRNLWSNNAKSQPLKIFIVQPWTTPRMLQWGASAAAMCTHHVTLVCSRLKIHHLRLTPVGIHIFTLLCSTERKTSPSRISRKAKGKRHPGEVIHRNEGFFLDHG